LAELRTATRAVHERLHEAPVFVALLEGRLPRAAYAGLLASIRTYLARLQPAAELAEAELDLPPGVRPRLALLEADLQDLGVAPPPLAGPTAPWPVAQAVGALYVVQGSALGGKVLADRIGGSGEAAMPRTYFQGLPDDGLRWRRLCKALDRYGEALPRRAGMIAGAQAAFGLFEACLQEGG
jgi:heme oxygenase